MKKKYQILIALNILFCSFLIGQVGTLELDTLVSNRNFQFKEKDWNSETIPSDTASGKLVSIKYEVGTNLLFFKGYEPFTTKKQNIPLGYHINVLREFNISKNFILASGAGIMHSESKKFLYSSSYGEFKKYYLLTGLTVPIRFLYFPTIKKRLSFSAGVFGEYLFISDVKSTYYSFGSAYQTTEHNQLKKFNYGFSAGIGYSFKINKNLFLDVSSETLLGIANLSTSKHAYYSPKNNPLYKTSSSFSVGIRYQYNKPKKNSAIWKSDSLQFSRKRAFVKFFYSPQLCYRIKLVDKQIINTYNGAPEFMEYYTYNTRYETFKYGYEAGLLLEFKIGKSFNLNTGLAYEKMGYQTSNGLDSLIRSTWSDGGIGWREDTLLNQGAIKYNYIFFSLPLILNYEIKIKNHKYYIGTGCEFKTLFDSWVVANGRKSFDDDDPVFYKYRRKGETPIYYFGTVNIGTCVPLSQRSILFIEPFYKLELNTMEFKSIHYKARLWSSGLRIGIKF